MNTSDIQTRFGGFYFSNQTLSMNLLENRSRNIIYKAKKQLQSIIDERPCGIRGFVADEALHYDDDPAQMFIDLSNAGCQCGTIRSLIYYADTHAFFNCYYEDIEDIREEYEGNIGEPIRINGDLKNFLAWFAFEETAYRMAREDLGFDL